MKSPKLSRREVMAAGLFVGIAAAASTEDRATDEPEVETDTDIRPTQPLTPSQAMSLMRPCLSAS